MRGIETIKADNAAAARKAGAPPFARARTKTRRVPGAMNKTEKRYADFLEAARLRGEIVAWDFEAVTFVLVHKRGTVQGVRYTPDFRVITAEGYIDFHEVKGGGGLFTKDSRIKVKLAAEKNPWHHFYVVKPRAVKDGGGWLVEEYADPTNEETD